jgi:Kef-type K+ transport system membrane component KefB
MEIIGHEVLIPRLFGALALILVLARVVGKGAEKAGVPSVLGELLLGVLLGIFPGFGVGFYSHPAIHFMMELGAILLLFEVGLESSFAELKQVGLVAGRVALVGVLVPVLLGVVVSELLQASSFFGGHLFIGATLAATSVGITARVLRDLGQSRSLEARVILAAAVFDDILGLVLLAWVSALIQRGAAGTNDGGAGWSTGVLLLFKSLLFIALVVSAGSWLVPRLFRASERFLGRGAVLITAFSWCLALSFLAHSFGLAPIIGAFFAGLVIPPRSLAVIASAGEDAAFPQVMLEDQLGPISSVFVPLFFVIIGMKVQLSALADSRIVVLGLLLSIAAIAGKLVSGWVAGRDCRKIVVGVGMIPRGEVGLIFASLGMSLTWRGQPLFSPLVFGAIVAMVTVTSVVAPVWLGYLLRKAKGA